MKKLNIFARGVVYLRRIYLIQTKDWGLNWHMFVSSDEATPHDHPWDSVSLCLWGNIVEHLKEGTKEIKPGSIVFRRAEDQHWLELKSKFAITLFLYGPWKRDWGFHTDKGWVFWKNYVEKREGVSVKK